jgi:tRNA(fMet)-specific endonuclease VapC
MNGYLLDTSTCIFLLRGKRNVVDRLNEIDANKCYISEVVVAELCFGAYYSEQIVENLRQVEEFVSEMKIVTFDETIHIFAQERAKLWKAGKKIEDFDLLIGCAAKAKDLTIVTHNCKHFENIEGLQIEDWAV